MVSVYMASICGTSFFAKNSDQSFSSHLLSISLTNSPSQRTEGDTWIPFCLANFTVQKGHQQSEDQEIDRDLGRLLVYLRSSVTALYPLGDPLIDKLVLNFSTALGGKTFKASCARFSRIWCVLRSSVVLLKYSDWFLNS